MGQWDLAGARMGTSLGDSGKGVLSWPWTPGCPRRGLWSGGWRGGSGPRPATHPQGGPSPQPGLPRATSNTRVRETVALELGYVNSSLQLLKEELEELDCGGDTDGPGRCEGTWGTGVWTRVCAGVCVRGRWEAREPGSTCVVCARVCVTIFSLFRG